MVCVDRPGQKTAELEKWSSKFFFFVPNEKDSHISSTLIRKRLQNKESLHDLVHPDVEKYLLENCAHLSPEKVTNEDQVLSPEEEQILRDKLDSWDFSA